MINSILSSLPLFFLSFFKISEVVCKKLIAIRRRFLWGEGGDQEHNKVVWVSWEDICSSKESEGLGVKNIALFNEAFFGENGGGTFSTKEGCGLRY